MSIDNHTFCWNGIISTDVEKTLAFFPEVLGWDRVDMDMGGDTVPTFSVGGEGFAHVRSPAMDGEPSWWNNYLRVEDVDAAAAKVVEHGGKILVPATDIPVGRFATVTSVSGAYFTLFREGEGDSGAPGPAIHWVELHSKDIDADIAFLTAVTGLTTKTMPMPQGPYHLLMSGEAQIGGAMAGQHAEAPSMWLAWAKVDNVDETLVRAANNGGAVVAPAWDIPGIGRMAICKDPAGVVFGVITPPAA